jgi:hypothetical protein
MLGSELAVEDDGQFISVCLPLLISNAEDTFSPDIRLLSVKIIGSINIDSKYFHEVYPSLLKRLDDNTDPIRIESAIALTKLFKAVDGFPSDSSVQYILNQLFIHFEDKNISVYEKVELCIIAGIKKLKQDKLEFLKTQQIKCTKKGRFDCLLTKI